MSALTFAVGGDTIQALFVEATDDALTVDGVAPCVVMAHGMAGTVDSGLEPFAKALSAAGLHVLAFDYRGFGRSGGAVRQTVSVERQLEDYRAALAAAAKAPGVDPSRLVLWGVSLAGGHVFELAASERVAAAVALVPLVSGMAAGVHAARSHPAAQLAKASVRGIGARVSEKLGSTVTMPVVGPPGSKAAFSLPGAEEAYLAIAGPTWRNEVAASITMELGSYRPAKHAKHIAVPMLVQIADLDRSAPPYATAKAAFKARAEVRHYPCDHFDVFSGEWHEAAVRHQISFLTRHLGAKA
ncbi:MAG TPA: alpha/beta fold hydrolase [Nocardioidaceae bacterium]|nr:alpha/beta fold hydrolase [Nocardioidaceae bacterium]